MRLGTSLSVFAWRCLKRRRVDAKVSKCIIVGWSIKSMWMGPHVPQELFYMKRQFLKSTKFKRVHDIKVCHVVIKEKSRCIFVQEEQRDH